jgi:hypothetical protein
LFGNRWLPQKEHILGWGIFAPRWLIAAWLSGYSHAKRTNLTIDLESFEENVNKLTNYCYDEKNFKVPIMEAIVRVLGK